MYQVEDIRHLHLELSSDCNARCPLCPRSFYGFPHDTGNPVANLSLAQLQSIIEPEQIAQLEEILISGGYGDFVMNPESREIIAWLREHNPYCVIKISTNGGYREKEWWASLAEYSVEIMFCIDGLEATHSIYRQDVDYAVVIKNAKAFIKSGGYAEWVFTRFEHNHLEIAACEQRAREIGFANFTVRDEGRNEGPVYDREGKKIFILGDRPNHFPHRVDTAAADKILRFRKRLVSRPDVKINCQVLKQRSIYINSTGEIMPCCYLAMRTTMPEIDPGLPRSLTLREAVATFSQISDSWNNEPLTGCQNFCGSR